MLRNSICHSRQLLSVQLFQILQIEGCVKEIQSWMLTNRLQLNGDKSELLVIRTRKQCAKLPNQIIDNGNSAIKPSGKAQNLGVVFDSNLSLKSYETLWAAQLGIACIISA